MAYPPKQSLAAIVEDNPLLSDLFARALSDVHYRTQIIEDGRKAITWLGQNVPEVLFLDLHLPYVSGGEILAQLREDTRFRNTYVVLITADARMGDILQEKADFLLNKPVDIAQLQQLALRLKNGKSA